MVINDVDANEGFTIPTLNQRQLLALSFMVVVVLKAGNVRICKVAI